MPFSARRLRSLLQLSVAPRDWRKPKCLLEAVLVLGLAFLVGQIVFLDWFHEGLNSLALGYWMFLFVAWAAARLGIYGVLAVLLMTAGQALLGAYRGMGFFAEDIARTHLANFWLYMVALAVVGMVLAIYMAASKRAEQQLRIAAAAFESQEGMVITDTEAVVLKVNRAFTKITGYTAAEALGQNMRLLSSGYHDAAFYTAMWESLQRHGSWHGEIWNRAKSGKMFSELLIITAVHDADGRVSNYVGMLTDNTETKLRELQRLADEAMHRDALVREVHHRIKNNLQGITGVLRRYAENYPAMAEPINQAISQVQSIAVIHGLQGRASLTRVRLCELTAAIATGIESLWQKPVVMDIPADWAPCIVAETEAVPLALVLNELISNAVKHGGHSEHIRITFRHESSPDMIQVTIYNAGQLPPDFDFERQIATGTGLKLLASLLPRGGARLSWRQQDDSVITLLELEPPIITRELQS